MQRKKPKTGIKGTGKLEKAQREEEGKKQTGESLIRAEQDLLKRKQS